MSSILLVTSSPRGAASHSTRVATELANKLQAKTPGAKIVTRDLANNPLPHIDADYASGIYTPVEFAFCSSNKMLSAYPTQL